MKKPKLPPNLPSVGDRVKLRGRLPIGNLKFLDEASNWARVEWDAGYSAPLICHLYELEIFRDI